VGVNIHEGKNLGFPRDHSDDGHETLIEGEREVPDPSKTRLL
jgi:hypothetical protein